MGAVLITGGTGLIGSALTKALIGQGVAVHHLGRGSRTVPGVRSFVWDIDKGRIEPGAFEGVDSIVHLAGAGIADKRWTKVRVQELINSRARSAQLLLSAGQANDATVRVFVSAAGVGYYGANTSGTIHTESDPPASDTIGTISRVWEEAVDAWSAHCRVVKLRMPIVLSRSGGALTKLVGPVRYGLGSAFGTGGQWMSWVHIDDLVRIYQQAITDERMSGAYNVNSGGDVTNATFMRTLARVMKRPYFLPNVPAVVLRVVLGELSSVLLEGSRISNEKLLNTGFRFEHAELEPALHELLD